MGLCTKSLALPLAQYESEWRLSSIAFQSESARPMSANVDEDRRAQAKPEGWYIRIVVSACIALLKTLIIYSVVWLFSRRVAYARKEGNGAREMDLWLKIKTVFIEGACLLRYDAASEETRYRYVLKWRRNERLYWIVAAVSFTKTRRDITNTIRVRWKGGGAKRHSTPRS